MSERHSGAHIALHWAMAVVMIAAFVAGEVMLDLSRGPEKVALMGWYAIMGALVAALLLPRGTSRRRSGRTVPFAARFMGRKPG
ncbi:MAG TPA: cytochrome b/b6 domain-containing protein [Azospirillum sp.]|nr:cytochrome b/b6 domain-containing protein [Azospirillum sp.]